MTCPNDHGVLYINDATTVVNVENLEIRNCQGAAYGNGCGIRMECIGTLNIRNCYFHDNEDGIMGGNQIAANILVEYCEFDNNGYGDVGRTHNIYAGTCNSFTMRYSYSHNAYVGHEVKTRGRHNYILYNRITDEGSTSSYEIDAPQGGTTYIIGNLVEQSAATENSAIITYAEEGSTNPDLHLYVINNTIVNNRSGGTFVKNVSGVPAIVQNNIFAGPGTAIYGAATASNNWTTSVAGAGFVNAAGFDYHLTAASTGAIDKGAIPSPATGLDDFSLVPTEMYVHPRSYQDRYLVNDVIDIGAYEYGIPENQTPFVDAGADQVITGPATASLSGFAADDGLPNPPGYFTLTWSKVDGPGDVVFSDPTAAITTASFSVPGTYVLQLGCLRRADDRQRHRYGLR